MCCLPRALLTSRRRKPDGLGPLQAPEQLLRLAPQEGPNRACLPRWTRLTALQEAEDLSDEPLLNYYTKEWDRYTTGASYVNRLFTYLNRHWVKREKDEGRKNIYNVYTVSTRAS